MAGVLGVGFDMIDRRKARSIVRIMLAENYGSDAFGMIASHLDYERKHVIELPRGITRPQAMELLNNACCGD